MNILYVTPYVPSKIRTRPYNLIRALGCLGHQITLLAAGDAPDDEQEEADHLREWGVQVEVFPVSRARSVCNCLKALPTREPLQAVYSFHRGMERRLGQLVASGGFDVVHVEHLRAARLVRTVDRTPVVYDSVDSISLLFEQAKQTSPELRSRLMTGIDLIRTRGYEAKLLTRYDQVVITSHRDREAMLALAQRYLPDHEHVAPITIVTNGVALRYFQPQSADTPRLDKTVIFTGKMSYHANIAGVTHFVERVLPRIWQQDPLVRFQIVGKDPPEAIRQLANDERIHVTGYVDDLRPYLARASVAVCPALYAVGIQNKVLEAMAVATPVVSTRAGCAALGEEAEGSLLIADRDAEFAEAVLRVIADPALAGRLSGAVLIPRL